MHNEPTREQLLARIAELERAQNTGGVKLAASGGISLYGNGRFPTTLFATGWIRTLNKADEIKACMVQNFSKLSFKSNEQRIEACRYLGLPEDTPAVIVEK